MTNSNNSSNSNNSNENDGPPSIVMAQCDGCGHRLPEANMEIHRTRCHIHRGVEPSSATPSSATPPSPSSTITTRAYRREEGRTLTQEEEESRAGENGGEASEAGEAVEESVSGEYSLVYPSRQASATATGATATGPAAATPAPSAPPAAETAAENHWACPRCTLHNPLNSNTCDACLYQRRSPAPQQQETNNQSNRNGWELVDESNINNNRANQGGFQVNITEVDPNAVTTAVNVASWGMFGALVGGPVGALVAGGTAAALGGMHQLQRRRQQQQQQNGNDAAGGSTNNNTGRQPFFTVTTTRYTNTPWGGTQMSVTSNASGQRRTMSVRDTQEGVRLNQMSPIDRHILQMLMSNAVRTGAATNETANQILEELLQQYGFPDEDNLRQGGRRAATPQQIEQNTTTQTLDKESIAELSENQSTCNICLEEFKTGDEMRKVTHCNHTFHKECIDRWLERVASCPICKHELNSAEAVSS
eukprot:CAMPEP_0183704376 /NCGR_PEP_ID=MMETSP0737-20130205/1709_1 /TAXON_ID=385413 /ORGANISM="Thalassiosira miniscula, Strain CCMP1093" /LENGTH=476 /DNA_ID=CAMNT_0025931219 /DNA_START=74 /DNA_END=1504 /DNA_ORIENTATION=-